MVLEQSSLNHSTNRRNPNRPTLQVLIDDDYHRAIWSIHQGKFKVGKIFIFWKRLIFSLNWGSFMKRTFCWQALTGGLSPKCSKTFHCQMIFEREIRDLIDFRKDWPVNSCQISNLPKILNINRKLPIWRSSRIGSNCLRRDISVALPVLQGSQWYQDVLNLAIIFCIFDRPWTLFSNNEKMWKLVLTTSLIC